MKILCQNNLKYHILFAVMILVILVACNTFLGNQEEKNDQGSTEEQSLERRNPFSLPTGIRFEEEKKNLNYGSNPWEVIYGISIIGGKVMANIEGKWVEEGDWVGEEQVVKIKKDEKEVVLVDKDGKERIISVYGGNMVIKSDKRVKTGFKEEE
jgi:hypothetical protein